jgi:Zn-dependent protease/CBS domain-containing protein
MDEGGSGAMGEARDSKGASSDPAAREPFAGVRVMTIAGIAVKVHHSWFIIFVLILWSLSAAYLPRAKPGYSPQLYWAAGALATLLFFLSVLAHEFCHSLVAKRLGQEVHDITLFVFGGVSRVSDNFRNPKTEFTIAIVGPLCSVVLAGAFRLLAAVMPGGEETLLRGVVNYLAWINLALAVFNLIPGFPLDGGRVLRALIWWQTGSLAKATRAAAAVGKAFSFVLMALGGLQLLTGNLIGGLWFLFIGIFLMGAAEGGYRETVQRHFLEGMKASDVMVEDVLCVPAEISVKELIRSYFLHYGHKGFPVKDGDRVIGMVFLKFVKDLPEDEMERTTVRQVTSDLSERLVTTPDAPLSDVLRKMGPGGPGRLLVMEADRFVGLVTRSGVFRLIEVKRALER